jgi:hypothetical protein
VTSWEIFGIAAGAEIITLAVIAWLTLRDRPREPGRHEAALVLVPRYVPFMATASQPPREITEAPCRRGNADAGPPWGPGC